MSSDQSNKDLKFWQIYTQSVSPLLNKKISTSHLETYHQHDVTSYLENNFYKKNSSQSFPLQITNFDISVPIVDNGKSFIAEKNIKKRMKKGQFLYDMKIDLHGFTQDQAFDTLNDFITSAYNKHQRKLLIITGRGRYCYQNFTSLGVLITKVPAWLKEPPFSKMVSVIEQASSYDGGEGALYVILKKNSRC